MVGISKTKIHYCIISINLLNLIIWFYPWIISNRPQFGPFPLIFFFLKKFVYCIICLFCLYYKRKVRKIKLNETVIVVLMASCKWKATFGLCSLKMKISSPIVTLNFSPLCSLLCDSATLWVFNFIDDLPAASIGFSSDACQSQI